MRKSNFFTVKKNFLELERKFCRIERQMNKNRELKIKREMEELFL